MIALDKARRALTNSARSFGRTLSLCVLAAAALSAAATQAQSVNPNDAKPFPTQETPEIQPGPPAPPGSRLIEIEEFRQLFIGKTLTFVLADGGAWGTEYYDPNGANVTFLHRDGECLAGHWSKVGDYYCFHYRAEPSCWLTYELDGEIQVLSDTGEMQRVSTIESDRPISCDPDFVSENDRWPSLPERRS